MTDLVWEREKRFKATAKTTLEIVDMLGSVGGFLSFFGGFVFFSVINAPLFPAVSILLAVLASAVSIISIKNEHTPTELLGESYRRPELNGYSMRKAMRKAILLGISKSATGRVLAFPLKLPFRVLRSFGKFLGQMFDGRVPEEVGAPAPAPVEKRVTRLQVPAETASASVTAQATKTRLRQAHAGTPQISQNIEP